MGDRADSISRGRMDGAVGRALAELGAVPAPDQKAVGRVSAALEDFLDRTGRSAESLDDLMLGRLALVALDPGGDAWMDRAGLLGSDSCGYPVEGGYYDVSSDLGSHPLVVSTPDLKDRVLARLQQEWADGYVLTGSASSELPWRDYVAAAAHQ